MERKAHKWKAALARNWYNRIENRSEITNYLQFCEGGVEDEELLLVESYSASHLFKEHMKQPFKDTI